MVAGLLLKRPGRLWKELSLQRCMGASVSSTNQGTQHEDAQWSNTRAYSALSAGPVDRNRGLLCLCSPRLLRLMDTMPAYARTTSKTLRICCSDQCVYKDVTKECYKGGKYSDVSFHPYPISKTNIAFEPASINGMCTLSKTSSKVLALSSSAIYISSFTNSLPQQSTRISSGFWSWRRRETCLSCMQSRSYLSLRKNKTSSKHTSQSHEDSVLRLDVSEGDTTKVDSPLRGSDNDFDFWNFPALTSSHYQDYERPVEMQMRKRVAWQTKRKLSDAETKLTEECIPKPRGRTYDFGLGDILLRAPPPLEAGARPQGGFDTNISLDECEVAPPPEEPSSSSLFLSAGLSLTSPQNLPWDTPKEDNGSGISADDAGRQEDCVQNPVDDDSYWDLYELDATAESMHALEAEEIL